MSNQIMNDSYTPRVTFYGNSRKLNKPAPSNTFIIPSRFEKGDPLTPQKIPSRLTYSPHFRSLFKDFNSILIDDKKTYYLNPTIIPTKLLTSAGKRLLQIFKYIRGLDEHNAFYYFLQRLPQVQNGGKRRTRRA